MTAASVLPVLVAPVAFGIGWTVGKMPCWRSWQGYAALGIVAPMAIAAGVPLLEVVVDCAGLGAGFALARR